jgi:hypothetical protein
MNIKSRWMLYKLRSKHIVKSKYEVLYYHLAFAACGIALLITARLFANLIG